MGYFWRSCYYLGCANRLDQMKKNSEINKLIFIGLLNIQHNIKQTQQNPKVYLDFNYRFIYHPLPTHHNNPNYNHKLKIINFSNQAMIKQTITLIFRHATKSLTPKPLPCLLRTPFSLFSQTKQPAQQSPAKQAIGQPQKRLSELEFDELIEMKTQESLLTAQKKVQTQQKKVQANHSKLKEMAQQMEYLQKHAEEIKQKQLKLVENIELQQQELKRVKVRAEKQVDDSKKYSVTKLAKELLEAADCINRCKNEAVKEYPESKDPFIIGIVETQKKLVGVLKSFEIQEFDPTGKEFDPNTQESLLQIPTPPGYTPNTVATTMRTGYYIKGRLLRSARVGIFQ